MLWLFGEIWVWLLLAFVLGAALAMFVLVTGRRRTRATTTSTAAPHRTGESAGPGGSDKAAESAGTARAGEVAGTTEPVAPAERTERIGFVSVGSDSGATDRLDSIGPPDEGRRQGILPLSAAEWHVRNEWPDERDIVRDDDQRQREH